MSRRIFFVLLGSVFALGSFIHVATLTDGHNWGGDFSQYIIHAKNIISQKDYTQGIMLNNPVVYPPGYPLLIAPWVKFFGVNFTVLKLLNIFFWYGALFPVFVIVAKRLGKDIALLFILFLAVSSDFFVFKQNVLSDVPFFFFVSYAIYFFTRFSECGPEQVSKQRRWFGLFVFGAIFSLLIRSAGVTLFVAGIFYFLWIKKDYLKAGILLLTLLVTFGLQTYLIGFHQGFFSQITANPTAFLGRSLTRSPLVFQSISWFFCPGQSVLTEKIILGVNGFLLFMAPILYCVIICVFVYQAAKKNLSFGGIFFFVYLALLVVWSGFEAKPMGFVRYTYVIIPFAFIFTWEILKNGIKKILPGKRKDYYVTGIMKAVLAVLIFLNIFNIYAIYDFNDDVLRVKANRELFEWVRQNISPDEYYMIWRPRPVALMTGRVGTVPWREDLDEDKSIYQRIKELDISYLIFSKYVDQALIFSFRGNSRLAEVLWENETYVVFQIL